MATRLSSLAIHVGGIFSTRPRTGAFNQCLAMDMDGGERAQGQSRQVHGVADPRIDCTDTRHPPPLALIHVHSAAVRGSHRPHTRGLKSLNDISVQCCFLSMFPPVALPDPTKACPVLTTPPSGSLVLLQELMFVSETPVPYHTCSSM